MAEHKETTRKCPICLQDKLFQTRNWTCSKDCADEAKRRGLSAKNSPASVSAPVATIDAAEEHHLRRENTRLRRELSEALQTKETLGQYNAFVEGLLDRPAPEPPAWVAKIAAGSKQATPTAFLSDTHFGEEVRPEQIEYLNGYGRAIGEARLKKFFTSTAELAHGYLKGLNYPGIVMPLGGDIFSGDIHEELARTNAGPIQEEILFWLDPMIAGIKLLADEFGKVYIPSVVGNHPRGTMKPSHKMRVPNNFDWLFSHLLAKFMKDDKRVTFQISDSADCNFNIYDTRYRLSHGDQFKGGSGIAGSLSPIMIGDARKRKRAQGTSIGGYDWLLLGHWHQRYAFKHIMVNGSLKGYDEYSYHSNFDFELPLQSFWLTDPKHGVTISAPIHVLGKDEPWMAHNSIHRVA